MNESLIKVEGVSKKFCGSLKRSLWYGVKDLVREIGGSENEDHGQLRKDEFWAARDISFNVQRGECLGLIGRNGAGKTTLLRMLNGLIKPDRGRIEMRGRVGAMIALGAGFNPVLTGRENIYVNASVLGFRRKEIDRRFDEIVEFAEIGSFIEMPVQSYSSGMTVRLGFAIASSLEPDVLLLDEVLAVGDAGFRAKCYNRVYALAKRAAIIVVSHDMPQISRLCTKCVLLNQGRVMEMGQPINVIDRYNNLFDDPKTTQSKTEGFDVKAVMVNGQREGRAISLAGGASFSVKVLLDNRLEVNRLEASLSIYTQTFSLISHINSNQNALELRLRPGSNELSIDIPALTLGSGKKLLGMTLRDADTNQILYWTSTGWVLNVKNRTYVPSPAYHGAHFSVTHCVENF